MLKYYVNGELKDLKIVRSIWTYNTHKQNFIMEDDWRDITHFSITPKDFANKIKNIKKTPTEGASLYFDGTSKFPRFKLQGTDFKRCIKIEKAEQIVVDQDDIKELTRTIDGDVWIVEENDQLCYIPANIRVYDQRSGESILDAINRNSNLFPSKKVIYHGKTPLTATTIKQQELAIRVIEGIYEEIFYDDDLDKIVSGKLESFDKEALDSIKEMLESKDASIVSVGLKLLPNYNVLEFPLTIGTILRLNNQRVQKNNVWNSTAVKQLRSTIDYQTPYTDSFPTCLQGVAKKDVTYTDTDKAFAKSLILARVNNTLDKLCGDLKEMCERYNIKIHAEAN